MAMTLDGSNGVTFNDASIQASAAAPFTLKNRIINGDMSIDQRNNGASLSIGASSQVYALDRYTVLPFGSGCTAQRVAGISGFQYALRVTGAAGNTQIQIGQKIESANTYDLINQNVTISFYAQASSSKTLTLYLLYPNTVDSWSGGYSTIGLQTFTATTSPQRFSLTFNAGSNAGNGLGILIAEQGFGASETFTITGVQLERGSIATQFEWLPISTELALCQRYCVMYNAGGIYQRYAVGFNYSTTQNDTVLYLPVEMRIVPTLTTTGTASNYAVYHGAGTVTACNAVPTLATAASNTKIINFNVTVASGFTTGGFGVLISNANTNSYIMLTAEL